MTRDATTSCVAAGRVADQAILTRPAPATPSVLAGSSGKRSDGSRFTMRVLSQPGPAKL
jgi:hypothetical protein